MMTRMTQVKAGVATDDLGEPLNNVEKVLTNLDIKLRDSAGTFRDMGSVIDEIATKWKNYNQVQQEQISTAVAGVRQQNIFMANKLLP